MADSERDKELLKANGNFVRLFQALQNATRLQGQDVLDLAGKLGQDRSLPEEWQRIRAVQRQVSTQTVNASTQYGIARLRQYFHAKDSSLKNK